MASCAPASTEGMYSLGMRPPVTLFTNSYAGPSDSVIGSIAICTLAN